MSKEIAEKIIRAKYGYTPESVKLAENYLALSQENQRLRNKNKKLSDDEIIDGMKGKFIGEFSWEEECTYDDVFGDTHDASIEHVVPWHLCKEIYQRMHDFKVKALQKEGCEE